MARSKRLWNGERYAVTRYWAHQPMPELKIWDKQLEVHVQSWMVIPENGLTPGNEDDVKQVALDKAKALDEQHRMRAA